MIDPKGESLRKVISSLEYKIKEKKHELDCLIPTENQVRTCIDYNGIQKRKLELLLLETTRDNLTIELSK